MKWICVCGAEECICIESFGWRGYTKPLPLLELILLESLGIFHHRIYPSWFFLLILVFPAWLCQAFFKLLYCIIVSIVFWILLLFLSDLSTFMIITTFRLTEYALFLEHPCVAGQSYFICCCFFDKALYHSIKWCIKVWIRGLLQHIYM